MKIIVVVDMQNDFIDGALGSPEAQAIVPVMVERLKELNSNDNIIVFTKDTHYDDYMNTQEGKNLPIPHCIEGTPGWSICKPIASFVDYGSNFCYPYNKNITNGRIFKNTFGSIHLAETIQDILLDSQVEEVILMGVCTDICVVSNAMLIKAFCPEVQVTVDASCCAGVTPERHLAALETMKSCQIKVINE